MLNGKPATLLVVDDSLTLEGRNHQVPDDFSASTSCAPLLISEMASESYAYMLSKDATVTSLV